MRTPQRKIINGKPIFNQRGAEFYDLGWQPVGLITTDGIEPTFREREAQAWAAIQHAARPAITYTLNVGTKNLRPAMNSLGIYRLPGDKPLIHNGGKPR